MQVESTAKKVSVKLDILDANLKSKVGYYNTFKCMIFSDNSFEQMMIYDRI